jgi:sulfiredoxin
MSDGKGIVADVPLSAITRPLDTPVDEAKVCSLMETLRDPATAGDVPPITLLWLTGDEGGQYYYSFGGCHRYTAQQRLGAATVRAVLQRATLAELRLFLGASAPERLR